MKIVKEGGSEREGEVRGGRFYLAMVVARHTHITAQCLKPAVPAS